MARSKVAKHKGLLSRPWVSKLAWMVAGAVLGAGTAIPASAYFEARSTRTEAIRLEREHTRQDAQREIDRAAANFRAERPQVEAITALDRARAAYSEGDFAAADRLALQANEIARSGGTVSFTG